MMHIQLMRAYPNLGVPDPTGLCADGVHIKHASEEALQMGLKADEDMSEMARRNTQDQAVCAASHGKL